MGLLVTGHQQNGNMCVQFYLRYRVESHLVSPKWRELRWGISWHSNLHCKMTLYFLRPRVLQLAAAAAAGVAEQGLRGGRSLQQVCVGVLLWGECSNSRCAYTLFQFYESKHFESPGTWCGFSCIPGVCLLFALRKSRAGTRRSSIKGSRRASFHPSSYLLTSFNTSKR